jgi:hypothetical protein
MKPAALTAMNETDLIPEDTKLSALLRESRAAPSLPPRFQENVWRRIESAADRTAGASPWLDALVTRLIRPRFALAAVAALVLAGVLLGVHDGRQVARSDAQAQYLASVAPNPVR